VGLTGWTGTGDEYIAALGGTAAAHYLRVGPQIDYDTSVSSAKLTRSASAPSLTSSPTMHQAQPSHRRGCAAVPLLLDLSCVPTRRVSPYSCVFCPAPALEKTARTPPRLVGLRFDDDDVEEVAVAMRALAEELCCSSPTIRIDRASDTEAGLNTAATVHLAAAGSCARVTRKATRRGCRGGQHQKRNRDEFSDC